MLFTAEDVIDYTGMDYITTKISYSPPVHIITLKSGCAGYSNQATLPHISTKVLVTTKRLVT